MTWIGRAVVIAVVTAAGSGFIAPLPSCAQGVIPGVPGRATIPDTTTTLGAHGRYSKAPIDLAAPNLALTVSMVTAGGGPATFDAQKLLAALTVNSPLAQTEMPTLDKKFGADAVATFVKTFGYVTTDALAQIAKAGTELPPTPDPAPADAKALAAALYAAGTMPGGRFDVEYMLDALVSHVVHVQVMNDIDANPELGPTADANYHSVLAQLMLDLKKAYDLAPASR